ncbi:hypothetical protein THASP1DRAFT_27270 [Thamnocephalis sphaerospora]|uniref:FIST domain-containing protein n=1 Tax=Thamnocephalis sphaerospora TaxID=78915 RepID=A0A4P9XZ12_9FUNG|nr:hypothetical protein THASP1DRAFT_27270 [Thamnocephalis sphaerospora]|eukprot:RKP10961.1 hypothetical protein THASP1DRAFT_27270 [Thamnocephalis sphaerospora]
MTRIQPIATEADARVLWMVYAAKGYSDEELRMLPQWFTHTVSAEASTAPMMLGCVADLVNGRSTALAVARLAFSRECHLHPFHVPASRMPPRRAKSVGRWPALSAATMAHGRGYGANVGAGPGAISAATAATHWSPADFRTVTRAPVAHSAMPAELNEVRLRVGDDETEPTYASVTDGHQYAEQMTTAPDVVLLATDTEPYALAEALQEQYPETALLGTIAASTPFVTGLPYTIYFNGKTLQDGAAGVAIRGMSTKQSTHFAEEHCAISVGQLSASRSFARLSPLGNAMRITRCRGNVIVDLDGKSAAGMLLAYHQAQAKSKQDSAPTLAPEYYLGVYSSSTLVNESLACQPENARLVARVISGDPSRGHLAVDTLCDLADGEIIQFFARVHDAAPLPARTTTPSPFLQFEALPQDVATAAPSDSGEQSAQFALPVVASENGVIMASSAPNATATEAWQLMESRQMYPHPWKALRDSLHHSFTTTGAAADSAAPPDRDAELGQLTASAAGPVDEEMGAVTAQLVPDALPKRKTPKVLLTEQTMPARQQDIEKALKHERDLELREELLKMFLADSDLWSVVDL